MKSWSIPLLFCLAAAPTDAANDPVTRADDGFHFAEYADGQHDEAYAEWWYFNLVDPAQGIRLAVAYSILDPAALSGIGAASVLAVVYDSRGSFHETATAPPDAFQGSPEQADVIIAAGPSGEGRIEVLGDGVYRISGRVAGAHTVSWDLHYVRSVSPWFGLNRAQVGSFDWERMSWLVYMPSASVAGRVVVDGRVYDVAGVRGYHDHNWGEWNPLEVVWNWAQYSEPGFALALGDFRNFPTGVVRARVGDEEFAFDRSTYHVVHSEWTYDGTYEEWVPRTSWLYAGNERIRIVARLSASWTEPIPPPTDWPLGLLPVVYEQSGPVSGSVWESPGNGEWRLRATFQGPGYKEYTTIVRR